MKPAGVVTTPMVAMPGTTRSPVVVTPATSRLVSISTSPRNVDTPRTSRVSMVRVPVVRMPM